MRLYYFTNSKYGLEAIRNQRYKLSTYDNLNDPFELFAADLADTKIRAAFHLLKAQLTKQIALLCCSKTWGSTLLWSHYADNHRGIALELDVADECIIHVKYQKTRTPISRHDMDEQMRCENGTGLGGEALAVKAFDWAYEEEARIPHNIEHLGPPDQGLHFCPFNDRISLRGVILGPLCTLNLNDIQNSLPTDARLLVRKSRIAFRSFKVTSDLAFKSVQLVGAV